MNYKIQDSKDSNTSIFNKLHHELFFPKWHWKWLMTVYYKLTVIQMMKLTMATKIHNMSIIASEEEDISICVRDVWYLCARLEYKR